VIPTSWRERVAFAIAPIGAVLTVAAWLWLTAPIVNGFTLFLVWIAICAYSAEIGIVAPAHLFLLRRQNSGWAAYAVVGALSRFAPFTALATLHARFVGWVVITTAAGSVSALLFYGFAVRRGADMANS
jgi:hypothetical protein